MASLVRSKACPSDFWKNAPLLNFSSPKAFWATPKAALRRNEEPIKESAPPSESAEEEEEEDGLPLGQPNEKGNQNEQMQPGLLKKLTNQSSQSIIGKDTEFFICEANDTTQPTTASDQALKVAPDAIFSFWDGMVEHFGGGSALLPEQGLLEILEILALYSCNQKCLSEVFVAVSITP